MTPILIRLGVLVAIFASIFIVAQFGIAAYSSRRAETKAVNRRLQLLRAGHSIQSIASILRKDAPDRLADDAGPLERLYFRFQRNVRMAALSASPRVVLFGCLLGFAVLVSFMLLFSWTAGFALSLGVTQLVVGVAAALAFGLPIMFIARMAEKRRKRMEEQFPVALDIFTRALRAGHPVASAIELLTAEMDDPIGSEFGLVADEVAYGANLTDALSGMGERWDLDDIRMFVVSLSLQNETGGNLAEILGNLSSVIRDRASMYMKVRALSSEGRMSGWMLTILPIFTFLSVVALNPGFYLDVADDPIFTLGFSALIVLYFIGVYIIRRMIDLKV